MGSHISFFKALTFNLGYFAIRVESTKRRFDGEMLSQI